MVCCPTFRATKVKTVARSPIRCHGGIADARLTGTVKLLEALRRPSDHRGPTGS
jgi:hypothetical protein